MTLLVGRAGPTNSRPLILREIVYPLHPSVARAHRHRHLGNKSLIPFFFFFLSVSTLDTGAPQ